MITHHNVEQGTEEWHAAREGKFTGSNAYKLLGSFGATEYAKAIQSGFKGNFYTKRGHILEDEAIELYEAIYATKVQRPGFVTNSDYSDCLYSPDGVDGETLVEVKCFNEKGHREMLNGQVPLKIMAQTHFGILITELKRIRLVIYNPELAAEEAFKAIDIPVNLAIVDNFKRILKEAAHAA